MLRPILNAPRDRLVHELTYTHSVLRIMMTKAVGLDVMDKAIKPYSRRFMATYPTRVLFQQNQPPPSSQPWVNPANRVPGQALKQYSTDLTQLAEEGKLDPVIGRHEEIRRALQILARRTKSNPVLIGEAGVGKTAIAEGLAQRCVNESLVLLNMF